MINAAWQDLKAQGAIGIYESDGILSIQMNSMDDVQGTEVTDYALGYSQISKMVRGVKYFSLVKKEVAE